MSVLSFIIQAKDQTSAILEGVRGKLRDLRSTMSSGFGQLGAVLGAGAVLRFTQSIVSYAGSIKDASEATGIAKDKWQALTMAGKTVGVGMDQLAMAAGRLKNIQGSIATDKGMQETFAKIGLSINDVRTSNPEDLLVKIAQGIKRTGDSSIAFDVFGRSASRLLTTLDTLAGGWDNLTNKFKGGIISDRDIEQLDAFGDSVDLLSIKLKVWGATAIGAVSDVAGALGTLNKTDLLSVLPELASGNMGGAFNKLMQRGDPQNAAINAEDAAKAAHDKENAAAAAKKNAVLAAEKDVQTALDALKETREAARDKRDESRRTAPEQLAVLEERKRNIGVNMAFEGKDSKARLEAETQILDIETEIAAIRKAIANEDEQRASKRLSLLERDRALREAGFTTEQKRAASTERAAKLAKELSTELDPDKRIALQERMMTEAETQQGLTKQRGTSISLGDFFAKSYSQGKQDPAHQQVTLTRRIVAILEDINKKPGGLGK